MNTTRAYGFAKALGFVAATCLAQAVTAHYSALTTTTVTEDTPAFADAYQPLLATTAPSARSCNSLDSFGNPVRPCRG